MSSGCPPVLHLERCRKRCPGKEVSAPNCHGSGNLPAPVFFGTQPPTSTGPTVSRSASRQHDEQWHRTLQFAAARGFVPHGESSDKNRGPFGRASLRPTPHRDGRQVGRGGRADAEHDAEGRDALVGPEHGREDGRVAHDGAPDLVGVQPEAAPERDVQAVDGPAVRRQGSGHHGALHGPAGPRGRPVRGREWGSRRFAARFSSQGIGGSEEFQPPRLSDTLHFGTGKMAGQGQTGPAASAAGSGSRHRFGAEPKVKSVKNLEHRVQRRIAIARQRLVKTFP